MSGLLPYLLFHHVRVSEPRAVLNKMYLKNALYIDVGIG
ncbi:hypothetical protein A464_2530 [Salmonella bongori N268-08]|uniref:Uncharacterized protein n=1 Tax=Salmonella bongori N268-08 TaxID=1197719 RepID=S5NAT3_SALBN|nr:hypothetical protein A464_2530 [Salmonella bongori N268-08]